MTDQLSDADVPVVVDAAAVRHVAQLAELAVAEADLPVLVGELEAIVRLVAQLDALDRRDGTPSTPGVPPPAPPPSDGPGPAQLTLRDDMVAPILMTRTPAAIAPAFTDGFFVVPRRDRAATE